MAGTTRLELATSAVTVSNGVGGHLLIPQGTECHFLSSPYCTQIELVPSPVYSRPSLRFLRSASCSSMLAMSRTGDRNVVARKRSNMVCNSTRLGAAARSNAASVPATFNPRWRVIVTPSRSSVNKRTARINRRETRRGQPDGALVPEVPEFTLDVTRN
jgi:hypothetical protein